MSKIFRVPTQILLNWYKSKGYQGSVEECGVRYFSDLTGIRNRSLNELVGIHLNRLGYTGSLEQMLNGFYHSQTGSLNNGGILFFDNPSTEFVNFYVSAAGNDSNDGLTVNSAWLTIAKVNSTMAPNKVIAFRRGDTFNDTSLTIDEDGVIITSYGTGANPILDGLDTRIPVSIVDCDNGVIRNVDFVNGTTANSWCISFTTGSMSNWLIDGCAFNDAEYGIRYAGSTSGTGTVINNCSFTDLTEDGVSNFGSSDVEVSYCTFTGLGVGNASGSAGDPISMHDTATCRVHHCTFNNNKNGGIRNVSTAGISYFYNNLVVGMSATPSLTMCLARDGCELRMWNNIIIQPNASTTANSPVNVMADSILKAWNCTVINLSTSTSSFNFDCRKDTGVTDTTSIEVKNCISWIPAPAGSRHIRAATATTDVTSNYNCFNRDYGGAFNYGSGNDFANWKTNTSQDANSFVGDPLLADVASPSVADDAKISTTSPCKNTGTDLSANSFSTDYFNTTRPVGSTWDVGAHEFV